MCDSSLPDPENLIVLGQATARDVLLVNVVQSLRQSVPMPREATRDGSEDSSDDARAGVDEDHSDCRAVGTERGG